MLVSFVLQLFALVTPLFFQVVMDKVLLLRSNGTDINQFCDVGVFVGRFPKTRESINVG